jgi:JmjC domain, hydroxylase
MHLHVDISDAHNVLVDVGGCDPNEPSARWDCFSPAAAKFLHSALMDTTLHKPESYGNSALGLNGVVFLGDKDLEGVKRRVATACPGDVVTLNQSVGDVIHVPPGWVHQVVNLQPCLKVACDVYDPLHYIPPMP